eukprot:2855290-Rhodomonas_salina.4
MAAETDRERRLQGRVRQPNGLLTIRCPKSDTDGIVPSEEVSSELQMPSVLRQMCVALRHRAEDRRVKGVRRSSCADIARCGQAEGQGSPGSCHSLAHDSRMRDPCPCLAGGAVQRRRC